jgi:predicted nuclease with TOPRIM domain
MARLLARVEQGPKETEEIKQGVNDLRAGLKQIQDEKDRLVDMQDGLERTATYQQRLARAINELEKYRPASKEVFQHVIIETWRPRWKKAIDGFWTFIVYTGFAIGGFFLVLLWLWLLLPKP